MSCETAEGKARVVAAMVAGRHHWVEKMKAEGRKFAGGRKLGSPHQTAYRPRKRCYFHYDVFSVD